MTNVEFANVLGKLAAHYRVDATLPRVSLDLFVYTKADAQCLLKAFGGKWTKSGMDDESEYAQITFSSVGLAPLRVFLPRNKVCRKTVTYECDPIMSPEEEAEMLTEVDR
jgi:hypothetical protein